jgi:hypothetical protein
MQLVFKILPKLIHYFTLQKVFLHLGGKKSPSTPIKGLSQKSFWQEATN